MGNIKKLAWVLSCTALALALGVGASASLTGSSTSDSTVPSDDVLLTEPSSDVSSEPASDHQEVDSPDNASDEVAATDTAETDDEVGDHPDNHGKYVSQVAKCVPPGPEHGRAVSEMARTHENEAAKAEELCSRYGEGSVSPGSSTDSKDASDDDAIDEGASGTDASRAGVHHGKGREKDKEDNGSSRHRSGSKAKRVKH